MNALTYLHATDDHGFPICRCPSCREKSKIINAQYVARLFGGIFQQGHDQRIETEDREQDYGPGAFNG